MKLIELFQDDLIRLPIYQTSSKESFRNCLFKRFDLFLQKINTLNFSEFQNIFSPEAETKKVEQLITGIKKSINLYLDGKPYDSYAELKRVFDMSAFSHLSNGKLESNQSLYRLRKIKGSYSLSQEELFHIPFHDRTRVSTQRYSIPGFPSLYASTSVYVAWEELERPTPENVQACRLENTKPLTYFDLTTDIYLGKPDELNSLSSDDLWKRLIVWPLIASCSVKVKVRENYFKPEYIIPQLVLQIVRNENLWDGIKFSSTHIDLNKLKSAQGEFHNFVIPVKENKDEGHCNSLIEMFKMTEVVSWQIVEVFTKPQGTFMESSYDDKTPYRVEALELIPNNRLAYRYSVFGTLEKSLYNMTPKEI